MRKIIKYVRENPFITIPVMKWMKSKEYNDFKKLLNDSENWTEEQVDSWQLDKVSKMVDYAYAHVEAYREKYKAAGFHPGDIRSWNDFESLPYVVKDEIKENFNGFCSDENVPSHEAFTSGSSGKPMRFLLDVATGERERALFHYYWGKYGFFFGEKCVLLRGQNVACPEKGVFYKFDRFQNYKMFDSTYAAKIENLDVYDKEIRKFKASFLQAYPSALNSFAKLYHMSKKDAPAFRSIFLGSEGTTPEQCEFIKKVFKADNVMYHYGHSECAVLALKYPEADKLGFVPVYGYAEIVDSDKICRSHGEIGEIVATGFNKSMPFIRYRTGDYTSYADVKTDSFMKNFKAVDLIDGRKQEYIVTKSKRLIPVVWLCGQHIALFEKVFDFQYEQEKEGELTVKVVSLPNDEYFDTTVELLQKELQGILSDVAVSVIKVDEIQKNTRGKRISMIQKLDTDAYR